eukprot:TRINITY_DN28607_c0_g1_i2.p1 TRINITY_DN28607_c0_g1~~TRINITY_DN28607_c0_g1_i2.p1  ORF type:complete len:1275 (-),score=297.81 TRINITY_DN28607_c0_g1_i2:103-3927(-)
MAADGAAGDAAAAGVAEDGAAAATAPPMSPLPAFGLADPGPSFGDLGAGSAVAQALAWLQGALREEQTARRALEQRLGEVEATADRACSLASSLAGGGGGAAGEGDAAPSGDDRNEVLWRHLRNVQQLTKSLQKSQEAQRKSLMESERAQQELLALRFDALRSELAGKSAAQAKEMVAAETRDVVEGGIARESERLLKRLEQVTSTVTRRLDMFASQLQDLKAAKSSRADDALQGWDEAEEEEWDDEGFGEDDESAAPEGEEAAAGEDGVARAPSPKREERSAASAENVPAVVEGAGDEDGGASRGLTPSHGGASPSRGSGRPETKGGGPKLKALEERVSALEFELATISANSGGAEDASEAPVQFASRGVSPASSLAARQSSHDGAAPASAEGSKPRALSSDTEYASGAPSAVAEPGSVTSRATQERTSGLSDAERIPQMPSPMSSRSGPELQREIMEWVEKRLATLELETKPKTPRDDAVHRAVSELRVELMEWLAEQKATLAPPRNDTRQTTATTLPTVKEQSEFVQPEPKETQKSEETKASVGVPATVPESSQAPASTDVPTAQSIAETMQKATEDLKEKVFQWLEDRLHDRLGGQDAPAAHSKEVSTSAPAAEAAPVDVAVGSESVVEKRPDQEQDSKTAIETAVVVIRDEVTKWLETEMKSAKDELLRSYGLASGHPTPAMANDNADAGSVAGSTAAESSPGRRGSRADPFAERLLERKMTAARLSNSEQPSAAASVNEADENDRSENLAKRLSQELAELRQALMDSREDLYNRLLTELRGAQSSDIVPRLGTPEFRVRSRIGTPAGANAEGSLGLETAESVADELGISQELVRRATSIGMAPDQLAGIRDMLLEDGDLLQALAEKLDYAESSASQVQPPGVPSKPKDSPKHAPNDGKAAGSLVKQLSKRLQAIEDAMGGDQAGGSQSEPAGFIPLLQVGDELRRLKTRFEYLERIAPPDVQRALAFFEPLRDDQMGASNGFGEATPSATHAVGSAAVMRRVTELQRKQAEANEEAKLIADDGRREVMNVSQVLRGVQRDAELSGAKMDDLKLDVKRLRSHVDAALPQVVNIIENLMARLGPNAGFTQDDIEGLKHVVEEAADKPAPHPFVSQSTLQKALDGLQKEVSGNVNQLRAEVLEVLRGKADGKALANLSQKLSLQEQEIPSMKQALQELVPETKAENAAFLKQFRCVSCNTAIEGNGPWKSSPPAPSGGFPSRAITGKDLRPMGAGMPRNISLPTLAMPSPKGTERQLLASQGGVQDRKLLQ